MPRSPNWLSVSGTQPGTTSSSALVNARKLSKHGGDAVSDWPDRDVDRNWPLSGSATLKSESVAGLGNGLSGLKAGSLTMRKKLKAVGVRGSWFGPCRRGNISMCASPLVGVAPTLSNGSKCLNYNHLPS